jgi:hypothetical protein
MNLIRKHLPTCIEDKYVWLLKKQFYHSDRKLKQGKMVTKENVVVKNSCGNCRLIDKIIFALRY